MKKILLISAILALSSEAGAFASDWSFFNKRKEISVVGSSTVSTFISAISEEFSRSQNEKGIKTVTPLVESTGSSNGFEMFCAGVGLDYPDVVDASRPIKESEEERCERNGVDQIIEIKIGYDGIVFGSLAKNKKINLTKEHIFLALAEKVYDRKSGKLVPNFYETWNQIDPNLPKKKILVFGPPLTSGTREVFADMMLEEVCFHKKEFVENYPDYSSRKKQCHSLRKDGKFIESGENDNVIVERLKNDPDSFGIFGYNFLVDNQKTVRAASIDGFEPNLKTISSREYPLSRPLFVYVKRDHLDLIPGIRDFVKEIISVETIGKNGYLINNGLVPLSSDEFEKVRSDVLSKL
jgi:phosphate transport system substrate-binding protein